MLETLCGTTSSVPTTKGLAQPSPHLFPMESIQRSAQMYKVLIPQTPKSSWRGHSLPWQRLSASSISCNALLDPFFYPTFCTPGEARGLFCPKPAKREQQRTPKGHLIQGPPHSITVVTGRVEWGTDPARGLLGACEPLPAPARAVGIPMPAPGWAAPTQAADEGDATPSKMCHVPGELFCSGYSQK